MSDTAETDERPCRRCGNSEWLYPGMVCECADDREWEYWNVEFNDADGSPFFTGVEARDQEEARLITEHNNPGSRVYLVTDGMDHRKQRVHFA